MAAGVMNWAGRRKAGEAEVRGRRCLWGNTCTWGSLLYAAAATRFRGLGRQGIISIFTVHLPPLPPHYNTN